MPTKQKIDFEAYGTKSFAKVPKIRLKKNINNEKDLRENLLDLYVLEDYMGTYLDFVAMYNHVFTVFVNCYPIGDLRNEMIAFKLYREDKMEHGLPFKKFILILPILGALQSIWNVAHIDDQFILDEYDNAKFNQMLDDVNYLLTSYDAPIQIRSMIITDTVYRYSQIAYTLADVVNVTLSLDDYLGPYLYEEDMKALTDEPIPPTLQPIEVKAEIVERSKKLKEIYTRQISNGIGIIIRSKTKVNERQFQEMNISFGQIPDVYGTFIMRIMKNNGFNKGLESPGDYYLAETVARYAAIINNDDMGEIGYFFRNVSIACGTLRLSHTIHDCKTNHYLPYEVNDLLFIEGKYYKENLSDKDLKVVTRRDTHLIGKTIYLRSAIYCACGDEICHVCYGEDYKYVYDLPGMGIYNSQIITNPVYQGILSVKHAIDGDIQTITNNLEFNEIFTLNENFVDIKDDVDPDEYDLLIEARMLDEMDYRSENFGLVSEPYILVGHGKDILRCELYNIQDITYNPVILHAMKESKKHPGYYQCPLSILDEDGIINITLLNYGVSNVLQDFKRLVKYDSSDHTVPQYLDEIVGIIKRAKIRAKLVQVEVLMNRLIRDPNDLTRRPNYGNDVCDEVIVSINKALMNNKGAPVRLAFEQVKRQLTSYTQWDQYGDAFTTPLFKTYLYTGQPGESV